MANARIGSHPSHGYQVVESLTTTKQLTSSDSGKIFTVDLSGDFTTNLPKLSTEIAGWHAKFIVVLSGAAMSLVAHGLPAAGGTTGDAETVWHVDIVADDAGGTANVINKDGISFSSGANKGDSLDIFTDGTYWYVTSFAENTDSFVAIDTD